MANECLEESVAVIINHDFYVDDLITGADSQTQLVNNCRSVKQQLGNSQFHLRKWNSNNPQIVNQIVGENGSDSLLNIIKNESSKTLGLLWNCKEDILMFSFNTMQHKEITKREILSIISQIFDPLGLINPCVLEAKIVLQQLWASKLSWDENVPDKLKSTWLKIMSNLSYLSDIKIPRHIICNDPEVIELHAFSDASVHAYSACIYLRSIAQNKIISVHLLIAKSRVSPIKPMTIPRLELCGAFLSARLTEKVKSSLRLQISSCTYWCDSTIVLSWLKITKNQLLKSFVNNRVSEILETSNTSEWRYIPTNLNPADIGSRGLNAKQLKNCKLWWSGPSFLLHQDKSTWPTQPTQIHEHDLPETKVQCHVNASLSQFSSFIERFSDFTKLQRASAYILRFIYNCRHPYTKRIGYLQIHELQNAHNMLCKIAQAESFKPEYNLLSKNKLLPYKNKFLYLNPFLHSDGLIRVGGRLSNSYYDYDTKHPIMMHASHYITQLIFRYYHKILIHGGPQLLTASTRHKYWTIGARNLSRKIVHNCVKCCRFSGKSIQPIMGNLPEQRLHADYPFINTAVDYAGPVMIVSRSGRGCKLIKSYMCIFVCLAIKAVHIELVTDLSKDAFISALNRFISRRGKPVNIFSDNGKCFIGASNELDNFLKYNSDDISSYFANTMINFKFSPAYSPHFNGLAESAVKAVKHHLKRVVSFAHLTYEEMNALLIQIEAILNSRPLTPISSDPSDLEALTPSHFLIGRALTLLPSPQTTVTDYAKICTLSRYMRIQVLKAHFWNRFYKEYISELQTRHKWKQTNGQLQIGEMVLIKDDRLPPSRWLLGRVTTLYPGSDGITRVADVRTATGTLRRAFNRLCPLPILIHPEVADQDLPQSSCADGGQP